MKNALQKGSVFKSPGHPSRWWIDVLQAWAWKKQWKDTSWQDTWVNWKWVLWNIGTIGYWIWNLAWNLHHSSRSVTSKKKSRWLSPARCRQTHIDSSWCHAKTCEAKDGNHMTRDVVSWQLAHRKTFWNVFSKHLLDQLDQFEKDSCHFLCHLWGCQNPCKVWVILAIQQPDRSDRSGRMV